jgi:hypothetical protein
MTDWIHKYPHIPLLLSMKPTIRVLLGQKLYWTEKKDGSNMAIWLEEMKYKYTKLNIEKFKPDDENWMIDGKVYSVQISSRKQQ